MAEFKVNDQSAAVAAMAQNWPMISGLLGGTAAMRAAGQTFLPKWPNESDDAYKARLASATLFPAFTRTTSVMAAKPFARPLQIEEASVPASVRALLDDVDMLGTPLQPFAGDLMAKVMEYGLVGVLVESPKAEGLRTVAEERAAGIRPYLALYPSGTILGWRVERKALPADGGEAAKDRAQVVLTQLRLLETYTEPNGEWGETEAPQVRVLTPGHWQVWRQADNSGADGKRSWELFEEGETSIDVIPFVFFYGIHQDFGVGAPPLLDLAFLNVEHWQSSSDQQTILHVARVPILFAKGFGEKDTITIGASTATTTTNADADLSYVEHTGAAIEAGRQSIQDLEDRMRQSGAELLVQQPQVGQTATAVRSDDEGNRSILQKIAEDFEESLEACLALMARWLGDKTAKPEVEVYKDFGSANLADAHGDLLLRAAKDGHVSSETAFGALKRMDVVAPDIAWADEKLRIGSEAADRAALQQKAVTDAAAAKNATPVAGPVSGE